MDELPIEEKSTIKQILNQYEVELMLILIENAINKNNFHVAKKYINDYKFEDIENWKSDLILCRSKILAMSTNYMNDTVKKLKCYLNSWSELDIIDEQCSSICLMKIHIHIANISKKISNILRSIEDINLLPKNLTLEIMNKYKLSNTKFENFDEILQKISCTVINNLKCCENIAINNNLCTIIITDNYLMLAQYCIEELNDKENTENTIYILFMESVLKAMKYGSTKASALFPIILQKFESLSDVSIKEIFITESQNVPEYMFLQWINQILGYLDTPLFSVFGPLLIRISQVYPKAVQLPLKIYMEKDVYNHKECEEFLKTKLIPIISDIHMEMFVKAISNVCCPFTQLLKYINDIKEYIKNNCMNTIVLAFENMFNNCFITEDNQKFKGKEFKILDIYKDKLKMVLDNFQSYVSNKNSSCISLDIIKKQVNSHKEEYYSRKQSTNLKNYCPWLAYYHGIDTIEIPGQYCGLKKPNPANHITITSFKLNVQVMYSMRNPIKITMIGNDGEKYNYLVKFGEDLRHDQRIQHLLQVMNNTLFENKYYCKRQISIFTYIVFPVSKMLGMIEWINDTVTLKDFICESFPDGKDSGLKQLNSKVVEHNRWLSEKSGSSNMMIVYTKATIEYNCAVTAAKFKQLVHSIPADILRKSLLNMCLCAEMYVFLRSKFITSYSVLSICHWLLGIGDRHLNNTIVSKKTGHCIGIDFNFAFHTATNIQVIPELIPFRMSPHIVSLMAPLNLTGFIRETMVNTLKILIDNKDILLSVMQVFITDPSADWITMSKTESLRIDDIDFDSKDIQWFPIKKILSGKEKLNGINPIEILSRELESSIIIQNDYKCALLNILRSDSQNNTYKRSKLPKSNVTPNQQVDCLLDISTDEHILGKSYGGLELWV